MARTTTWSGTALRIDLGWLAAGTPCQPFSRAGIQQGVQSPRFVPTQDTLLLVLFLRPRVVVFENVPEIATWCNGSVLAFMLATLREAGYCVDSRTHRLAPWLPQNRERWFLTAIRGDSADHEAWREH